MILIDLYKKGKGVIKTFNPVDTEKEAEDFIESYCKENNVTVTAREHFDGAHWNYLSDGTEIDYCSDNF